MSTIQELYGIQVAPYKVTGMSTITTPHVVESSELVGIEVEIENVAHHAANAGNPNRAWSIIDDGSLRNGGREFVSRPIMASSAPLVLEYLFKHYLSDNCCFSPRTSVHVHLNMLDFTKAQVYDYVLLYSIFERLFYRFTGRGRMKNIYCVPLVDTTLLTNLVEKTIDDGMWSKYTGLNLLPILRYGTVEFRHMHGSSDVGKLAVWINLICKLKEYVRAHSTKDIRSDIAAMDDDYPFAELLSNIFGEFAAHLKIGDSSDITYLNAKQALSPASNAHSIRAGVVRQSDFYNFKER